MIKIAFSGAAGKMGKRLVALGSADDALQIVAALDAPGSPALGLDAGENAGVGRINVPITDSLPAAATPDVVVDFSSPAAFDSLLALCVERKIALVYATTGLNSEQIARLEEAAKTIPVLRSPSMSPSVNLTMKLAQIAARMETEAQCEACLVQMGFSGASAVSGAQLLTLLVPYDEITGEADHNRILDAICGVSGLDAGSVKIILTKK